MPNNTIPTAYEVTEMDFEHINSYGKRSVIVYGPQAPSLYERITFVPMAIGDSKYKGTIITADVMEIKPVPVMKAYNGYIVDFLYISTDHPGSLTMF